ncbi:MAG: ABC-2 family transporter protein, partial [Anaeroplasmataceae bacterium]|nr:ABC-2 family transporter protein [Anaeroplasmataceae bacterium]
SYTRYPLKIFPKIIQGLLIFVFPFAVAISFPAEAILFQDTSVWLLSLEIIGVASVFLLLSIGIWSYFVRKYESTGS